MSSDAERETPVPPYASPALGAPGALAGKVALVAASAKLSPGLTAGLAAMGARALPVPVLEAREVADKAALDGAIGRLARYDWIVFTSAWGVAFFDERLRALRGGAPHAHDTPKACAIGPATAAAARERGFHVELTAGKFVAEGVLESLERRHGGGGGLQGLRILLPRAAEAREFLPEALAAAGCEVDVVPCYESVRPAPDAALRKSLGASAPDLLVFTSAAAVRNFLATAAEATGGGDGEGVRRLLCGSVAAAIGPVTAAALAERGKIAEIVPAASTVPALLDAIRGFFSTD
ncbi:MAG: uroporphyrinogen-III synthase [Acidobacteriota bacterium]|jgi:uroporphyrinogen III methyltransferase/synthase|nr:uroporphyrinogen-III synthase [Acidobacteriota bacterium]